jgi:hypothetical protein
MLQLSHPARQAVLALPTGTQLVSKERHERPSPSICLTPLPSPVLAVRYNRTFTWSGQSAV